MLALKSRALWSQLSLSLGCKSDLVCCILKQTHNNRQPHPIFVIALVGPDETPFGIQKDFLCSRSTFYKKHFDETPDEELENLVRLPDTSVEVFAYAQNFLYTGNVFPALDRLPSYDILIGVWKLGHDLGIDGLCDAALEAMIECRRVTQHIPATPLLVQVWKETPEGSSIRRLLLTWTAEYMRSSETRAEFARSLPQEVLSELVVAMSSLNLPPLQLDADSTVPTSQRRSVPNELNEPERPAKKRRTSEAGISTGSTVAPVGQPGRKPGPRASLPGSKPGPKPGSKRRASAALNAAQNFSANQKLNFCADLLSRMLSGPGIPPPILPSLCEHGIEKLINNFLVQVSGRGSLAPSKTPLIRSATACPTI